MMKKSFLMIGALCLGTAFVSCVDDSESDEVKDLRQVQLEQKKVDLESSKVALESSTVALEGQYWTNYDKAVTAVETLLNDLKTAQENLDGVKSGKLTHEAAKEAAIAYQNAVIARNQKDIKDKENEIAAQKKMAGMTQEQIDEAKINANIAKEKAIKEAQDFWIQLTQDGYNKDYAGKSVAVGAKYAAKIGMLLSDSTGDVRYKNNKLNENKWVKAMNKLYSKPLYYYVDADGLTQSANLYDFFYKDDDDTPGTNTYTATSMISSVSLKLEDENGYSFKTYTKYTYKDLRKYKSALGEKVKQLKEAIPDDKTDAAYPGKYNEWAQYKSLQDNVNSLIDVLSSEVEYSVYEALLNKYVDNAKKIYSLESASAAASTIAAAYNAYTVSDNENTIATLEDAIDKYNTAIKKAKKEINEVIENEIVDDATAISYYESLIAEINSDITVQKALAEKYRKLLTSSNTQSAPAAETPAAE